MLSDGSGFFIDGAGHILTNEHVIRAAVDLRVRLHDGREVAACVVGADALTDLALLKGDVGGPVQPLPFADSDAVRVGETAVAIGSPFGFSQSVTAGIVSAKDRVIERSENIARVGEETYSLFIQTDAAINVGNSGGPLLDAWGGVVGVNAAFWGGAQPAQGVSFAIPVNVAKRLLPRLRATGQAQRSYLGVDSQPLTAALAEGLGLREPRGALIAAVETGSAAEAAGLEPGDVVLGWDERTVSTAEDFKVWAQLTPPHTRVRVRLSRNGVASAHALTTRPAQKIATPRHPAACGAVTTTLTDGFEAIDLPPGRAKKLPGGRGVEVTRVQGGAAREAGLNPGDVVLRAGRKPVATVGELRRVLLEALGGVPVPLLMRREGEDFWAAFPRR